MERDAGHRNFFLADGFRSDSPKVGKVYRKRRPRTPPIHQLKRLTIVEIIALCLSPLPRMDNIDLKFVSVDVFQTLIQARKSKSFQKRIGSCN
jgi:hypothetical protein